METITEKPKVNKKNLTAYWGIHVELNEVLQIEEIKTALTSKPNLKPLQKIHSTLLYVGKKEGNANEVIFGPLENKECELSVTSFGLSDNALCVKVTSVTYLNENNESQYMPSFATQQHITLALNNSVKAVDSIKAFTEGNIIDIPEYKLKGHVKRYLF